MQPTVLTRTHRALVGVVVTGATVIAGIGFAGSYTAVRELAERKGFGAFAAVFPLGIDAGIVVLLALDLLLTWIRIPFPLLRQTAWLLTAATIAFNGAAAWPDALGVGMHATIPVLFITTVEAARHAIGRIADITADRHMESVRLTRWLLAAVPTFRLWRRMKLWELRSYEQALAMERDRLVYQTRLRAQYGRGWRRKAPVEALLPLKLAKYGVPVPGAGGERTSEHSAVPAFRAFELPERRERLPRPRVASPAAVEGTPRVNGRIPRAAGRSREPGPPPADPVPEATVEAPAAAAPASPPPPPASSTRPEPAAAAPAPATALGRLSEEEKLEVYYAGFKELTDTHGQYPKPDELSQHLFSAYRLHGRSPGQPVSPKTLHRQYQALGARYAEERDLPP